MAEVSTTDGSVGDDDPRRTMLDAAVADLVAGADRVLGDRFRKEATRPRDGAGWIDVTTHDLSAPCPARWAHPSTVDDYADSAANASRRLGRRVLRARRPGEPVDAAVRRVLADTDDWDTGLRDWFEELDRSGRATVAAAATSWAVGALNAVRGRELQWSTGHEPGDQRDRMVRHKAGWDAIDGRRRRPTTVLVMAGGLPDPARDELVAGFTALVVGHGPRCAPERVRIGSAAGGTARAVAITPAVLGSAVDRVLELLAWRSAPDDAVAVPGQWCRWCHLLESCDVGRAVVEPDATGEQAS
jgi:hypothetical protein